MRPLLTGTQRVLLHLKLYLYKRISETQFEGTLGKDVRKTFVVTYGEAFAYLFEWSIAGVSRDERTESGFTRSSPEQTPGKETGSDWKYQVHLYLSRRGEATLAKVRVHEGTGNKGWRENGHGGATCSYNFDSLFSTPCHPRGKGTTLTGERQKRSR